MGGDGGGGAERGENIDEAEELRFDGLVPHREVHERVVDPGQGGRDGGEAH